MSDFVYTISLIDLQNNLFNPIHLVIFPNFSEYHDSLNLFEPNKELPSSSLYFLFNFKFI